MRDMKFLKTTVKLDLEKSNEAWNTHGFFEFQKYNYIY